MIVKKQHAYIGEGKICASIQNLQPYITTVLSIEEERRDCGTV